MISSTYPDINKKTILIIDDCEMDRENLKSILKDDYNILEAQNGREGLGILKSNYGLVAHMSFGTGSVLPSEYSRIQLILVDIMMPVVDGHEFLRQMREYEALRELPVIVVTSLDDEEEEVKCLEDGAIDIITKPFSPVLTKSRVKNILKFKESIKAASLLKYDSLTGLKKRSEYYKDIDKVERNEVLKKKPLGIVFVDINKLKIYNNNFGHEAGDRLIKKIAGQITDVFGAHYSYRFGGDEFIVLSFDDNEVEFNHKVTRLKKFWDTDNAASLGYNWLKHAEDIELNTILADKQMYLNKNRANSDNDDKEANRFFENSWSFAECLPGGFMAFHADESKGIIMANSSLLGMLGYKSVEELRENTGNSFIRMVYPDDLNKVKDEVAKQVKSSYQSFKEIEMRRGRLMYDHNITAYTEHRIMRRNSDIIKVSNYLRMVRLDSYGDVYFAFINDIKREFEYGELGLIKQLDDAKNHALEASEAKSMFLYNMSHDIRTPMNAIAGYTQLAIKNIDKKELLSDYLKKMEFAEGNLMGLINNILEMSSIENNKVTIKNTPMCVSPAIENIKIFVEEQCKNRNITLKTYFDVKHHYFYQDMDKNAEVTINIINNAIKYTPKGGQIAFGLRELPGRYPNEIMIEFTCSDNGVGMSKEFLERAFNSFERERNLNSTWQGSGLGLGIVKKLVELMDGRIEIISERGKGTTVKTYTPHRICTKAEYEEYMNSQTEEDMDIGGCRILVVDDNDLNLEITAEILNDQGVSTECATNGREACSILLDRGPGYFDAVIMDIQMPLMDGFEATRIIRKFDNFELSRIPIVALTAHAFDRSENEALHAGMNGYISKPLDVKKMVAVLGKLIKR